MRAPTYKRRPRICRDVLMETDWEEGFTCSLPATHRPSPHRAEGEGILENNVSVDSIGRKYRWVMEWSYE